MKFELKNNKAVTVMSGELCLRSSSRGLNLENEEEVNEMFDGFEVDAASEEK